MRLYRDMTAEEREEVDSMFEDHLLWQKLDAEAAMAYHDSLDPAARRRAAEEEFESWY